MLLRFSSFPWRSWAILYRSAREVNQSTYGPSKRINRFLSGSLAPSHLFPPRWYFASMVLTGGTRQPEGMPINTLFSYGLNRVSPGSLNQETE